MEMFTLEEDSESRQIIPASLIKLSKERDRFTVRIDTYWETFGEPMVGVPVMAAVQLNTQGIEPYIRKFKAPEKPKELPLGDIDREDVGYILIYNTEGTKYARNPSEEERADCKLRVAVFNGFEIDPYGMPFFGKVSPNGPLMVHCKHGQAVLQVVIYPR
jgi:hypothetical protein